MILRMLRISEIVASVKANRCHSSLSVHPQSTLRKDHNRLTWNWAGLYKRCKNITSKSQSQVSCSVFVFTAASPNGSPSGDETQILHIHTQVSAEAY